jgi:hypothetical protein
MNFSHGDYEYHQSVINNARAAEASEPGRPLAIALDTVTFTLFSDVECSSLLMKSRYVCT